MKNFSVTFYMQNGEKAKTVISGESVQAVNQMIFSQGPFLLFSDQSDEDNQSFTVNINNVNLITYSLYNEDNTMN